MIKEEKNREGKTIGYRDTSTGNFYRTKQDAEKRVNAEGKKQGADGKACWEGYRYQKSVDGRDICVKVRR